MASKILIISAITLFIITIVIIILSQNTRTQTQMIIQSPTNYSQNGCPIGYYDKTQGGKKNKWVCGNKCPGGFTDNLCNCVCLPKPNNVVVPVQTFRAPKVIPKKIPKKKNY